MHLINISTPWCITMQALDIRVYIKQAGIMYCTDRHSKFWSTFQAEA